MNQFISGSRYIVLTGNYGSGKTELALNLALQISEQYQTTLVDLDIVNPYFRSGEKAEEMRQAGVRMLMPTYAMTTVDIPALPAEIQSVFEVPTERVIFDVGGDDTGAAALGRFYPSFMAHRDETGMLLVINCMRPLTREADEIIDLAERIQNRGRLKIDMLVNNTNLAQSTTEAELRDGKQEILEQCRLVTPTIAVRRHMVPEWMD